MNWVVSWPGTADELLFWCVAVATWMVVNYGPNNDPIGRQAIQASTAARAPGKWIFIRSVAGSALLAVTLVSSGVAIPKRVVLVLSFAVGAIALPTIRERIARSNRFSNFLAEWELCGNLAFMAISAQLVGGWNVEIGFAPIVLPLPIEHLCAITLCMIASLFVARGGNHLVRGILDKAGALPMQADGNSTTPAGVARTPVVDEPEYNRGRLIGSIERILLLVVVVIGSYEAIGFLVAAKGLIRAKEFEDRDFAEYFIIGSLASALVALSVGLILRFGLDRLLR